MPSLHLRIFFLFPTRRLIKVMLMLNAVPFGLGLGLLLSDQNEYEYDDKESPSTSSSDYFSFLKKKKIYGQLKNIQVKWWNMFI